MNNWLCYRLALSQESILERDKSLEGIEQKYVDVQVELKKHQQEVAFSNEALTKSRQELQLLQAELSSVKDEKQSFDSVIQTLKGDMTKVESSFHHIKQELAKKTSELNRVKLEKEQANEALASRAVAVADASTAETAHVHSSTNSKSEKAVDNSELQLLKAKNTELTQQLENFNSDMNLQIQTLLKEKKQLEQQLAVPSHMKQPNSSDLFNETVKDMTKAVTELAKKCQFETEHVSVENLVKTYSQTKDVDVSDVINENCALKMTVIKFLQDSADSNHQDMSVEYKVTTPILFTHSCTKFYVTRAYWCVKR